MAVRGTQITGVCGFSFSGVVGITALTGSPLIGSQYSQPLLTNGTSDSQINSIAYLAGTLTGGGTTVANLFDGTLLDLAGDGVTFTGIRAVGVFLGSTTGQLRVGGATTDPHPLWFGSTTAKALVNQGGPAFFQGAAASTAVTSGACQVLVENVSTASADYVLVVGGVV